VLGTAGQDLGLTGVLSGGCGGPGGFTRGFAVAQRSGLVVNTGLVSETVSIESTGGLSAAATGSWVYRGPVTGADDESNECHEVTKKGSYSF
jgi:hypothetical protein